MLKSESSPMFCMIVSDRISDGNCNENSSVFIRKTESIREQIYVQTHGRKWHRKLGIDNLHFGTWEKAAFEVKINWMTDRSNEGFVCRSFWHFIDQLNAKLYDYYGGSGNIFRTWWNSEGHALGCNVGQFDQLWSCIFPCSQHCVCNINISLLRKNSFDVCCRQ